MSKREKCVYCGKVIVTRSKEHIIQNAIGGLSLKIYVVINVIIILVNILMLLLQKFLIQ